MQPAIQLDKPIKDLLRRAGICESPVSITPASIGGNNRLFKVETNTGVYAVKQYFRHEQDQRNRLASEYAFLAYAGKAAAEYVPQAYACDQPSGLALYEYLDGSPISHDELDWNYLEQAVAFFCKLNQPTARQQLTQLPKASEACFSIAEHLGLIDARLNRIRTALSTTKTTNQLAICSFLDALETYWIDLNNRVRALATEAGQLEQTLDEQHCCISPSDFGFHNALLLPGKQIKFIDFEYAGLDDPAKMVGDFFAQLAVPVPGKYYTRFVQECMQVLPDAEKLVVRASWLRPVYQVKWCCIALNVFLPEHMARRKFANPNLDEKHLKQIQLHKAEIILKTLQQETLDGVH